MSGYNRSTRECFFSHLRPELRKAIQDYVNEHQLGDIEKELLACCETTAERKDNNVISRLLAGDPDQFTYTALLATPAWLIWARSGASTGALVNSAQLKNIQVREYYSWLTKDAGLEVFGVITGTKTRVKGVIGMGPEPAAQKFRDILIEANKKANPMLSGSPRRPFWEQWRREDK